MNSKFYSTDTGEESKIVHMGKRPKVGASIFRRVRATSMTQRRVEISRVHFWTFSPVSVKPVRAPIFFLFEFLSILNPRLRSENEIGKTRRAIRSIWGFCKAIAT